MAIAKKVLKRKRGRPPKSSELEKSLHDVIVDAAKQVCCENGVHGLTVELILRTAGVSRPTFYKFFRNKDEVLDLISKDVNQKLVDAVSKVFIKQKPDEAGLVAVIDAYLDWGIGEGAIVGRLYQAIKDETSLVTKNREDTVRQVIMVLQRAMVDFGRLEQDPLLLDALINTVEYLCTPLFTKEHPKEYFNRIRQIVLEILGKMILQ